VSNALRTDLAAHATRSSLDPDRARAGLDIECRLVAEAILLVSCGGSRRVTVVGLRLADEVIDASRSFANARCARLVRLPHDNGRGADVAVERLAAADGLAAVG
jgi:hypothetical protein